MSAQRKNTEHPIHQLLQERWSPRAFADKPVEKEKLLSLLEAARWAPSSFNEQPWNYIVTCKQNSDAFQNLLGALNERNREWAQHAPVLLVSIAKINFSHNGSPNPYSWYDVGQAAANMTTQATALGLYLHQMAGFDREAVREMYHIPHDFEPVAIMAVGYPGDPEKLPEPFQKSETAVRNRKPLSDFIFTGLWNQPSKLITDESND